METNLKKYKYKNKYKFKSYYVVWKLLYYINNIVIRVCLNRTMQYGNGI